MKNATDVVTTDLDYVCNQLEYELMQLSGKHVLIAGGAGFLGYYLVQAILYWNEKKSSHLPINLVVYDNFMRGIPSWLEQLNSNPNLKVVKHDVINPLPQDVDDFQYIIHAATIASPIYYRKNPIETMDANVNGLRHFLDYCVKRKNENMSQPLTKGLRVG